MIKILLVGLYEEIDSESMNNLYEFLDSIQSFAQPVIEGEEKENSKFIYIEKHKYDRFDKQLIENIEINEFNKFHRYFYCYEIDERFTNTKYYKVETEEYEHKNKKHISETLTIKYDDIVDDLYYKRYIYEYEEEPKKAETKPLNVDEMSTEDIRKYFKSVFTNKQQK